MIVDMTLENSNEKLCREKKMTFVMLKRESHILLYQNDS